MLGPPFALLIGAGFSAQFTGLLAAVQIVTGIFLHANVRWRWRPLHRIVITPEFHHWHHSNEPAAHNTNYSVFLPVWDMVFGTYRVPSDQRPQAYGVSDHVPEGVIRQLLHPFGYGPNRPACGVPSGIHGVRCVLQGSWPRAGSGCRDTQDAHGPWLVYDEAPLWRRRPVAIDHR